MESLCFWWLGGLGGFLASGAFVASGFGGFCLLWLLWLLAFVVWRFWLLYRCRITLFLHLNGFSSKIVIVL